MLKAKLVVVGGDAKAREVDLNLPTTIGRGREASLTLPHPLVSRQHTELFEKDGYLYVKDLGSLNGTYVNNRRIESEQRLAPNQLLTLGNVTFRAMYDVVETSGVLDSKLVGSEAESDTKDTLSEKEETVTFERFDKEHNSEAVKNDARKALKTGSKQTVNAAADESVEVTSNSPLAKASVKPAAKEKQSANHVETPSDIFSGDEEFLTPEKSISLSSLDSLPPVSPVVSVLGGALDLGDQPQRAAINSVDLDIDGQSSDENSGVSDPALGSFLKKLPR